MLFNLRHRAARKVGDPFQIQTTASPEAGRFKAERHTLEGSIRVANDHAVPSQRVARTGCDGYIHA
jgi:hypothetical protein